MNHLKKNDAFTLIEMLIVFAIITVLVMLIVPKISQTIEDAKLAADQAVVRQLNSATALYYTREDDDNPFDDSSKSSSYLLGVLVDEGFLEKSVQPQSKNANFVWIFEHKRWYLELDDVFYIISLTDGLSINNNGYYTGRVFGSYSSVSQSILIPLNLDGVKVTRIWQDVFRSKGLTSVEFASGSQIVQIHARAFYDNDITSIDLPSTLERVDLWAFKDNQLTELELPTSIKIIESQAFNGNDLQKITINADEVSIGDLAFGQYTESFKQAYTTGKAGTYLFDGDKWIKQID
ncbi:MAG: leucine-rich repeat protein [Erysipelotrichaceae bacterium]|nr:leucine-rich repeat protein [Erysipelotrichaceae bacterium]MDD3924104.1 leucine-rich repeat protein [Erysipelotrichaceae bacterium]